MREPTSANAIDKKAIAKATLLLEEMSIKRETAIVDAQKASDKIYSFLNTILTDAATAKLLRKGAVLDLATFCYSGEHCDLVLEWNTKAKMAQLRIISSSVNAKAVRNMKSEFSRKLIESLVTAGFKAEVLAANFNDSVRSIITRVSDE